MEVFILIAAFFVLSVGVNWWTRSSQDSAWSETARRLEMSYDPPTWLRFPTLSGTVDGESVVARNITRGSGKSKKTYTVVEVQLRGSLPSLHVYREGFFQKMGKALGGKEIQVGDPELDQAFIIKGFPRDEIVAILTNPDVRAALLEAQQIASTFRIQNGTVGVQEYGRTTSADRLESFIRASVRAASAVNNMAVNRLDGPVQPAGSTPMVPASSLNTPGEGPAPTDGRASPQSEDSDQNTDDWW